EPNAMRSSPGRPQEWKAASTLWRRSATRGDWMLRLRSIAAACGVTTLVLVGCSSKSTSPKPVDGVLLHASDVSDMRLGGESAALTVPDGRGEPLGHGGIFRSDGRAIAAKRTEFGLVRAHVERLQGGGTRGPAFVPHFRS